MYAPSDFRSITLSGGCGSPHTTDGSSHAAITCAPCEAVLAAHPQHGFATRLESVKPTCDEIGMYERADKQAKINGNAQMAAWQMSNVTPTAAQPSLLDQIAKMSAEEKDALRSLLGATPPALADVTATVEQATSPKNTPVASAKRTTRKAPTAA